MNRDLFEFNIIRTLIFNIYFHNIYLPNCSRHTLTVNIYMNIFYKFFIHTVNG